MNSLSAVVLPLRIVLVVLFAGTLVGQFLSVPGTLAHLADRNPGLGAVPGILFAAAIVVLLVVQLVIVCIWRLLGLVHDDRIFTPGALRWVDVMVWALVIGWAAFAAASAVVVGVIFFTPELRDPGMPMLLFGVVCVGAAVVLTVVVMRALLAQATALDTELKAVI